jgi:tRNA(Arg) A34 adenosine deaminase TadA
MCALDRRDVLILLGGAAIAVPTTAAGQGGEQRFVAEAFRMRAQAIASGDQPYGAVLVRDGVIVGYGPSRVVVDRNPDAHAERVAIWDAQRRLGSKDLSGALLYSTSVPCAACQREAAAAKVARMFYGSGPTDGGPPAPGSGGLW